jgi:hypothetical protein
VEAPDLGKVDRMLFPGAVSQANAVSGSGGKTESYNVPSRAESRGIHGQAHQGIWDSDALGSAQTATIMEVVLTTELRGGPGAPKKPGRLDTMTGDTRKQGADWWQGRREVVSIQGQNIGNLFEETPYPLPITKAVVEVGMIGPTVKPPPVLWRLGIASFKKPGSVGGRFES